MRGEPMVMFQLVEGLEKRRDPLSNGHMHEELSDLEKDKAGEEKLQPQLDNNSALAAVFDWVQMAQCGMSNHEGNVYYRREPWWLEVGENTNAEQQSPVRYGISQQRYQIFTFEKGADIPEPQ
ncbi:hypothetical protein BDK51DRAFT_30083 [Blyttiomyces helicus]|uniref:Uncharacterized protein n=1 Tax=Blyttiomyces helicus TaxID=388810 RepID=A0A4V1ISP5_9FUNG|nr:hypothetical protein BDK51DRAFT_30083 [Blyttiomyces helicus]|eukprot:RKO94277.1 hypothetical protein BDK51DRAFT_30083 [Blyttiomyces helicus]